MKKKLLSLLVLCIMSISLIFTGCSSKGLKDNPATDANVISNGGMTVIKGDYLYYINGYIDESDTTVLSKDDNKFGQVNKTGIYRTKLVDGQIQKDEDGFLKSTDLVVSKVVGFSNGGFYIIDDYIYYATPYMKLDSQANLQTSRVEFHKIKIDGTEDSVIYVTSENEDKLDWTLYKVGNTVYLTTYVASKLIIVNTSTNKVVTTIDNAKSYAFLFETNYNTGMDKSKDTQNYIYYTRDIAKTDGLTSDYKGNIISRVKIDTGVTEDLEISKDYTYTIKYIDKNNLYYLKSYTKMSSSALKLFYKKPLADKFVNTTDIKLCNSEYNNYYICPFGDNLVLASNTNGTFLIENGVAEKILTNERTIVAVYGNNAYYIDSNKLYRFNVRDNLASGAANVEAVTNEENTYIITNEKYIDFDNQRVYVFAEYTADNGDKNNYMNYITDDLTERFVGEFESDDVPTKPEQNENYGEDPDVKYIPHID